MKWTLKYFNQISDLKSFLSKAATFTKTIQLYITLLPNSKLLIILVLEIHISGNHIITTPDQSATDWHLHGPDFDVSADCYTHTIGPGQSVPINWLISVLITYREQIDITVPIQGTLITSAFFEKHHLPPTVNVVSSPETLKMALSNVHSHKWLLSSLTAPACGTVWKRTWGPQKMLPSSRAGSMPNFLTISWIISAQSVHFPRSCVFFHVGWVKIDQ